MKITSEKRNLLIKILFFAFVLFSTFQTYSVYAYDNSKTGAVVQNENGNPLVQRGGSAWNYVYSGNADVSDDGSGGDGKTSSSSSEPSKFETKISDLIKSLGDGVHDALAGASMDIDSVILGRVGQGNMSVNYFSLEFTNGNPYGVISAVIYSAERKIAYLVLALIFLFNLVKQVFFCNSGAQRQKFKSSIANIVLWFILLELVPYLLDLAIFLRDLILKVMADTFTKVVGSGPQMSIYDNMFENYEKSKGIVPAILLLSVSILGLWFMFSYIGVAMGNLVLVICFPILVCMGEEAPKLISQWKKVFIGNLLVPVIDLCLLYVIIASQKMMPENSVPYCIVQLIMCAMIIPSRGMIRNVLGVGGFGEMAGLAGMASMLMAGKAAMGIGKKLGSAGRDIAEGYSDYRKGKAHEELGKLDKEEESNSLSNINSKFGNLPNLDKDDDLSRDKLNSLEDSLNDNATFSGLKNAASNKGIDEDDKSSLVMNDTDSVRNDAEFSNNIDNLDDGEFASNMDGEEGFTNSIESLQSTPFESMEDAADGLGDKYNSMQQELEQMQQQRSSIDRANGMLQEQKASDIGMIDNKLNQAMQKKTALQGTMNEARNELADHNNTLSANNQAISGINSDISAYKLENAQLRAAGGNSNLGQINSNNVKIAELESKKSLINDQNAGLKTKISQSQANIGNISNAIGKIDNNIARQNALKNTVNNKYAAAIATNNSARTAVDTNISNTRQQMSNIQTDMSRLGYSIGTSNAHNGNAYGTVANSIDRRRQDIIKRQATLKNFDSPEFRGNFSNSEMSEMYKKRAVKNILSGVGKGATTVAGAGIGLSSSAFFDARGKAALTLVGAGAGDFAYNVGVGAISAGVGAKTLMNDRNYYDNLSPIAQKASNTVNVATPHYNNAYHVPDTNTNYDMSNYSNSVVPVTNDDRASYVNSKSTASSQHKDLYGDIMVNQGNSVEEMYADIKKIDQDLDLS